MVPFSEEAELDSKELGKDGQELNNKVNSTTIEEVEAVEAVGSDGEIMISHNGTANHLSIFDLNG